ncbi:MAG: hypothetical protein ACRD3Q_03990, partial [Terriglobales bacterium]
IEATERTLGLGSFSVHGDIVFDRGLPPLKLDNTYSGDFGVPVQASLGIATPLAYAMSAGFDQLKIREIAVTIDASERKRVWQVDQVAVSKRDYHSGDDVQLAVTLAGENGAELLRTATYRIPLGAPAGPLQFTVSDASTPNLTEYQEMAGAEPKSPAQLIANLNRLRPNTGAYVRVWRPEPDFQIQGADLPDPPASITLLLARSQAAPNSVWLTRGSTLAELAIDIGDAVVTGSKTVQVDVRP